MASALVAAASERIRAGLPDRESIIRNIKDWEAGAHKPSDRYRLLYCRVFGKSEAELFGEAQASETPTPDGPTTLVNTAVDEISELGLWVETTNVGTGALAHFEDQARYLARESLRAAPGPNLQRAAVLTRRILLLVRDGHQHLTQTRDLYMIAGKLCALMSWASSDLGKIADAYAYAHTGTILANQIGHHGVTALLLSARSKAAFWEGKPTDAATLARQGFEISSPDSARVLLACQEADAWQVQGAVGQAKVAIDRARRARNQINTTDGLGGPFECGPARQANYEMGVHLRARETASALKSAAEAEQAWKDGDTWAYGTWAQVRIGSAIAYVMAGQVDGAGDALQPVLQLPDELRLATLAARLTRELTPLLGDGHPLALRDHVREYCLGSTTMGQIPGG
ncbi:XRE family transcriptional regulator [Spongiactinospora rosea]|uniref:XRE family transcriptional regulator n=2 Tax=Spongiactinospora rosea TaxID=2248750 RepID=A0A366M792_9ACTN|nr:XRE family transcriptional regulator [Spongiactinospora rosea]